MDEWSGLNFCFSVSKCCFDPPGSSFPSSKCDKWSHLLFKIEGRRGNQWFIARCSSCCQTRLSIIFNSDLSQQSRVGLSKEFAIRKAFNHENLGKVQGLSIFIHWHPESFIVNSKYECDSDGTRNTPLPHLLLMWMDWKYYTSWLFYLEIFHQCKTVKLVMWSWWCYLSTSRMENTLWLTNCNCVTKAPC